MPVSARIFAVIIGVSALLIAGAMLWRTRPLPYQPDPMELEWADRTARLIEEAPFVSADDRSALREAFESSGYFQVEVLDSKSRTTLSQTLAEFISLRSDADAEQYAEWMDKRGATLKTPDQHDRMMPRAFRFWAGRDLEQDDTPWDIFRVCFEGELSYKNGITRPVGLGAGRAVIEIHLGRLHEGHRGRPIHIETAFQNAPMPMEWFSGGSITGRQHWMPAIGIDELLERDGEVLCARVLCGLRTNTNDSLPVEIILYYEPGIYVWHLERMMYVNTHLIDGIGPEF